MNAVTSQRPIRLVRLMLSAGLAAALVASQFVRPAGPAAQAAAAPAPVLVVVNPSYSGNPFGPYLGEILRAEGLNSFDVLALGALTASDLSSHAVTILAETPLTAQQAALFAGHVTGGGRLIAMRPDAQIAGLFGLGAAAGTQANGYLKFDTADAAAAGLTASALQIHGTADRYLLAAGGERVAELYSTRTTAAGYPAVARGSSGRAVAFTYDLARNVAYTRQGNPALANRVDTLGTWDAASPPVTRTIFLFGSTNFAGGAPLWIDRELIPVPQADEQMRLLARLVRQQLDARLPMPQLWYFPGTARTMLILTGDAHANPASAFSTELQSLRARNAAISLYMTIGGNVSESSLLTWQSQGNVFGIHPYAYRPDTYPPYNVTNLSQGYAAFNNWFALTYPSVARSATVRHHQIAWQGWTDAAELAASYGIGLDGNFYHWGPWLKKADGTWPHGYLTGSGQSMRFIRADGTVLPVFQQVTQLVDEQLVLGAGDGYEGLSGAQAAAVSQQLINASQAGDYAALMTQFHVDYYGGDAQAWAESTVSYANSQGVPVWNADRWLAFTSARHDAALANLAWDPAAGQLSFEVRGAPGGLSVLLPQTYAGWSLASARVDGGAVTASPQVIKGTAVAFVTLAAGDHTVAAAYQPAGPTYTPGPTNTAGPAPSATPTSAATATSLPAATPTSLPQPSATPGSGPAFPSTTVLDAFNRADGGLGANWAGAVTGYSVRLNQMNVAAGGDLYWAPKAFGPDQEAFLTVSTLSASASDQDLLLKVQSAGNFTSGLIEVLYDAVGHRLQVWTYAASQGWVQQGADLPVVLADGDQLGARALSSGSVEVYRNGAWLGARSVAAWPFAASGGYLGIWFAGADGVHLDDFGGGDVSAAAPTATPTATAVPLNQSVDDSLADFSRACAAASNVLVGGDRGGAVTLGGALADNFGAASLDPALWSSGDWGGGAYTPALTAGQLVVLANGGGWVRSNAAFLGGVIEADAVFGNASYQHIGFGSQDFAGNRYMIFSTAAGDGNLWVRVNNNVSEQSANLGPLPAGLHRYRVAWGALNAATDRATFAVDGVLRAQFDLPGAGTAGQYVYFSNGSSTVPLAVDGVQALPPYRSNGVYQGCPFDAGAGNEWQAAAWQASVPAAAGLSVDVRVSADGINWSAWGPAVNGGALAVPGRFAQYRLLLSSSDNQASASVDSVTLTFGSAAAATATNTPLPTATNTPPPTATNTPPPTATNTPLPTATNTPLPTATNTPPPTATNSPLPTPTATASIIFADGFESGNLSAWSASATNGGNLSVSTAAALAGTYGLRVNVVNNTAMYLTDNAPAAERLYTASFRFDPNTIAMSSGNAHYVFYGYTTDLATVVLRVEFGRASTGYQMRVAAVNNSTSWTTGAWVPISDAPHTLSLTWQAATAAGAYNGSLSFTVDGVTRTTLTSLNNNTRRIERIRLGPVSGLDSGTRGTYFLDAFTSQR